MMRRMMDDSNIAHQNSYLRLITLGKVFECLLMTNSSIRHGMHCARFNVSWKFANSLLLHRPKDEKK
jgi:hypothetical protein